MNTVFIFGGIVHGKHLIDIGHPKFSKEKKYEDKTAVCSILITSNNKYILIFNEAIFFKNPFGKKPCYTILFPLQPYYRITSLYITICIHTTPLLHIQSIIAANKSDVAYIIILQLKLRLNREI